MTKTILIIEDELAIRESILEMLEMEGFESLEARNGIEGVNIARSQLPDLIICDVTMPEMNGYKVLESLRQSPATASIPFIFLTAHVDKANVRQGMTLGADDYLTKPFTRDELLRAISTQLAKQATINKQVESRLDDLRSRITLALPHELNSPLNIIANSSKLLIDEHDLLEPKEVLEIAEDIYDSSQRLYRLIQNFLLYSQLELAAVNPERFRLLEGSCASSARALITDVSLQKAYQVKREADLNLNLQDAAIQISEIKLKKIVEELIDNAFKFSQKGTVVQVNGVLNGDVYTLSLTDNGRGMTANQIASIGAYMQFERELHEQQGAGLGLVIAKRMIELHSGEFAIESIPGQQTTVIVTLPIASADSSE